MFYMDSHGRMVSSTEYILSLSSLMWRPTQLYLRGEGQKSEEKKSEEHFYSIHIKNPKNKSLKSNISKTVRDREKVSMEVR